MADDPLYLATVWTIQTQVWRERVGARVNLHRRMVEVAEYEDEATASDEFRALKSTYERQGVMWLVATDWHAHGNGAITTGMSGKPLARPEVLNVVLTVVRRTTLSRQPSPADLDRLTKRIAGKEVPGA